MVCWSTKAHTHERQEGSILVPSCQGSDDFHKGIALLSVGAGLESQRLSFTNVSVI